MAESGQAGSTLSSRLRRGSPSFIIGQKTLSTTAQLVVDYRADRAAVLIVMLSAIDVYIGGDNSVTSSTGTLLLGTKGTAISIPTTAQIWMIAASGSPVVSYMDFYG